MGRTWGSRWRKGEPPRNPEKGEWIRAGVVSLTAPSEFSHKDTEFPFPRPPLPLPPPCKHGFAKRGAQSSVELLQWLAWGLGPQRNLYFPSLPTLPFPESDPLPHKTWFCSLGVLAFPLFSSPNPNPYYPSLDSGSRRDLKSLSP